MLASASQVGVRIAASPARARQAGAVDQRGVVQLLGEHRVAASPPSAVSDRQVGHVAGAEGQRARVRDAARRSRPARSSSSAWARAVAADQVRGAAAGAVALRALAQRLDQRRMVRPGRGSRCCRTPAGGGLPPTSRGAHGVSTMRRRRRQAALVEFAQLAVQVGRSMSITAPITWSNTVTGARGQQLDLVVAQHVGRHHVDACGRSGAAAVRVERWREEAAREVAARAASVRSSQAQIMPSWRKWRTRCVAAPAARGPPSCARRVRG